MISSKKIGIVCPIESINSGYSIATVVKTQYDILRKKGHQVYLICNKPINDHQTITIDYDNLELTFSEVESKVDILISHDIFYIHDDKEFTKLGKAINSYWEKRLIVFYHSSPVTKDLPFYPKQDKTIFVALSSDKIISTSRMWKCPTTQVVVVHNAIDACRLILDNDPTLVQVYEQYKLFSKDLIITQSSRNNLAKQPNIVLNIVKQIKELSNLEPFFIFIDSYINSSEAIENKQLLINTSNQLGLIYGVDWGMTSPFNKNHLSLEQAFKLQQLSDVSILPSIAESFSLATLEGCLSKNLIITNKDLDYNFDLFNPIGTFESPSGIHYSFGSTNKKVVKDTSYYQTLAKLILDNLSASKQYNSFSKVRKYLSPEHIYTTQLEYLLNV